MADTPAKVGAPDDSAFANATRNAQWGAILGPYAGVPKQAPEIVAETAAETPAKHPPKPVSRPGLVATLGHDAAATEKDFLIRTGHADVQALASQGTGKTFWKHPWENLYQFGAVPIQGALDMGVAAAGWIANVSTAAMTGGNWKAGEAQEKWVNGFAPHFVKPDTEYGQVWNLMGMLTAPITAATGAVVDQGKAEGAVSASAGWVAPTRELLDAIGQVGAFRAMGVEPEDVAKAKRAARARDVRYDPTKERATAAPAPAGAKPAESAASEASKPEATTPDAKADEPGAEPTPPEVNEVGLEDLSPEDRALVEGVRERSAQARAREPEASRSTQVANNGSGESPASQEAVNRQRDERAAQQTRAVIHRNGSVTILGDVGAQDRDARPGETMVQRSGTEPGNEWQIVRAAPDADPRAVRRAHDALEEAHANAIEAPPTLEAPEPLTPEDIAGLESGFAVEQSDDEVAQTLVEHREEKRLADGFDEAQVAAKRQDEWITSHEPEDAAARFPHIAESLGVAAAQTAADAVAHLFDDLEDEDDLGHELPNRPGKRPARTSLHLLVSPEDEAARTARGLSIARAVTHRGDVVQYFKRLHTNVRNFLTNSFPSILRADMERASSNLISMMATTAFEQTHALNVIARYKRILAPLNHEQWLQAWDRVQTGAPLPEDFPIKLDWDAFIAFKDRIMEAAARNETHARGFLSYKLRKYYWPLYARLTKGAIPMDMGEGARVRESFEHQRKFKTMRDMVDAGVEPFSMNIADHLEHRLQQSSRYQNRWIALRDVLGRVGEARIVEPNYQPLPDEIVLQTPDHGAHVAMPRTLHAMLKNTVLHSQFDAEARVSAAMLVAAGWKSIQAAPILFGSLFHPFHIELYASRAHAFTEALAAMSHRDASPARIIDFAHALSRLVTGPIGVPKLDGAGIRASEVLRAARGKGAMHFDKETGAVAGIESDPAWGIVDVLRGRKPVSAITTPEAEGIRLLATAGADVIGGSEWESGAAKHMRDAFAQQTANGYLKAAGWAVPTTIRAMMAPIMNYYVPWMKTRALFDGYAEWIKDNPGARGSEAERLYLTRSWREISERFGEMNTKNLMWSRWITSMFQGSMLSFGWNMGLVSQFGGGEKDIATALTRALRGEKAGHFRSRLAYSASYLAYGCGIGYLLTKYVGGVEPQSIKDCVYPILYHDKSGNPVRSSMPWLGKDFGAVYARSQYEGALSAVAQTAADKGAPLFSMGSDLVRNENFFGQQIVDPGDPLYMRMGQAFKFVAESELPLSVQNMAQNSADLSGHAATVAKLLNVVGYNKAPAYVTNDPWVNKIRWIAQSQHLEGATPYASAQKDNAMYAAHLKALYEHMQKTGDPAGFFKAFNSVVTQFHLDKKQAKAEMQRLAAPKYAMTLRELPIESQVELWNSATPAQRRAYYKYFGILVRTGQAPGVKP